MQKVMVYYAFKIKSYNSRELSFLLSKFFNYYCNSAVNVAWCCEIYTAKLLNGSSSRILNGPGTKSRLFEGPKKSSTVE